MSDASARDVSDEYPPPRDRPAGRPFTIGSFVAAGVALLFFPPLAGLVGVVLGVVGLRRGDRPLAAWAIAASVAGAVLGMLIGYALLRTAESEAALHILLW